MDRDGQGQQTITDLERARERETARANELEERRKREEARANELEEQRKAAAERAEALASAEHRVEQIDQGSEDGGGGWKKWAIIGGVGALVLLLLIGWGLYVLGDDGQSALERLRDIAIIFIVLLFSLVVIILAGIAAALGFLVLQIKDRVIPLLEELAATMRRFRGTAEFVTEEAVKPIMTVASTYAKMRAMTRTVTGKDRKGRKR